MTNNETCIIILTNEVTGIKTQYETRIYTDTNTRLKVLIDTDTSLNIVTNIDTNTCWKGRTNTNTINFNNITITDTNICSELEKSNSYYTVTNTR